MRFLITVLFVFLAFAAPGFAQTVEAAQDRIIARVNTDIITSGDVWSRYRMIQRSAGLPDNPQIRKEAFPQVLNTLIEEKLQLQEARRQGISVGEQDIFKALEDIAKRNETTTAKLMEDMKKQGVSVEELKRQTRAQIAWQVIVGRVVRPLVDVSDSEVRKLTAELDAKKGLKEFKIAEIQLPAADPAQTADSLKLGKRLMIEMQKGARFRDVAGKFSTAPSAVQGGLRGWVQAGDFPAAVEAIINKMPVKALSDPIAAEGKVWMVLKLDERVGEGAPDVKIVREKIGTRKLEQAAYNYLKDLREDALIEYPNAASDTSSQPQ